MQEVLQADWQEVWHSLQPPFAAVSFKLVVLIVLICFIFFILFYLLLLLYHNSNGESHLKCKAREAYASNYDINVLSGIESFAFVYAVRLLYHKSSKNQINFLLCLKLIPITPPMAEQMSIMINFISE